MNPTPSPTFSSQSNREATTLDLTDQWWFYAAIGGAVVLFFCGALICFWYKQKKRTEERREKRENMLNVEEYRQQHGLNIDADQITAANRKMWRAKGKKNNIEVGTDDLYSDGEDEDSDTFHTDDDFEEEDDRDRGRREYGNSLGSPSDGDEETHVTRLGGGRKPPNKKMKMAKSKFDVGGGGGGGRSRGRKKYKPKRGRSKKTLPKVDSGSYSDDEDSY